MVEVGEVECLLGLLLSITRKKPEPDFLPGGCREAGSELMRPVALRG